MSPTIHDANHFGPLTEERLAKLEAKLDARLAEDYRSFLLKYNGGRPIGSGSSSPGRTTTGRSRKASSNGSSRSTISPMTRRRSGNRARTMISCRTSRNLWRTSWRNFRTKTPTRKPCRSAGTRAATLSPWACTADRAGKVFFYDDEIEKPTLLAMSFTRFLEELLPTEDEMDR